jgi:hypothetical protein
MGKVVTWTNKSLALLVMFWRNASTKEGKRWIILPPRGSQYVLSQM